MDKGVGPSGVRASMLLAKVELLTNAMMTLQKDQRQYNQEMDCRFVKLHLAVSYSVKNNAQRAHDYKVHPASILDKSLHNTYSLEWRASRALSTKTNGVISTSHRLSPFDASHKTYEPVRSVLLREVPSYYKMLAAYENLRITLNLTYRAVRALCVEAQRVRYDSALLPHGLFDKESAQLSRRILARLDQGDTSQELINSLLS